MITEIFSRLCCFKFITLPRLICLHILFFLVFRIKKNNILYRIIFCLYFSQLLFYFVLLTLACLFYSIYLFVGVVFKDTFFIYTQKKAFRPRYSECNQIQVQTFLENEIFLCWESESSIA